MLSKEFFFNHAINGILIRKIVIEHDWICQWLLFSEIFSYKSFEHL
jgi:hypothetical protein